MLLRVGPSVAHTSQVHSFTPPHPIINSIKSVSMESGVDFVEHFRHTPSTSLPIDARLQDVLNTLKNNQVIICEAGTGAGKTTRLPQAVLLADEIVKVYMTQPRRDAVRWIARRIAKEMQTEEGDLVGWSLAREKRRTSKNTRLEILVDMSLVNRITHRHNLPKGRCVIIVDEAHERSVSIDLLLGLIKKHLPRAPNCKVIIASATIDTQKFSDYFDGAPILQVDGRCYPVQVLQERLQRNEHHSEGACRVTIDVVNKFLRGHLWIKSKTDSRDSLNQSIQVTQGTFIILLPGKADILNVSQNVSKFIEESYPDEINRVDILTCSSETSPEDKDRVMKPPKCSTLRLVFGTEILRTSVTVPETVGVIDTLEVKRMYTNPQGVSHLSKVPVSKAEAKQAEGRAGRTQPGLYIPISGNNEFDYSCLEEHPKPALFREPLTRVSLQVAQAGASLRNFDFIDRPDDNKIGIAIDKMKNIGALDSNEILTDLGQQLLAFQLDPEHALSLLNAEQLGISFYTFY